jgi:hypothetical protein
MVSMTLQAEAYVLNFCWTETTGASTASIVAYSLVHSDTPGLVSCHNSMEKSISFTSMTVQMLLTIRLPCMLVIIGQLPWNPSATHFPTPEVIMDNIVRRAVTRVEFYGNFINSDSPIVTDSLLDLLFHGLSCHTLQCSSVMFCRPF